MISLIAAMDQNRLIGANGELPWHLPSELQYFKSVTLNKPIIMGRNTWDSLPRKPLPKRRNIVVSSTLKEIEGAEVFDNLDDALLVCEEEDPVIIGGAQLYKYALDHKLIDRLYITEVCGAFEGDTSFPNIDMTHYKETSRSLESGDNFPYFRVVYDLINKLLLKGLDSVPLFA
jgi:dihydrofolate reductase